MSEKNITTTFTGVHICQDAKSWIAPSAYYTIGYFYYGSVYSVGCYSFTTPSFSGSSKSIQFSLKIGNGYTNGSSFDIKMNYAICTSDLNKNMYCSTCNSVVDEYQIASGIWEITSLPYNEVARELLVESNKIKSGKVYYLFFWGAEEKDDCCSFRSHYNYLSDPCVNITYSSANVNIYTKNDIIMHASSYIATSDYSQDNQLSFVPAAPYICVKKYYNWDGLFQGTVTGVSSVLNIRSGPGTNYDVVISVPKETIVAITEISIGSNGNVWAKMNYNGYEGWCDTTYLSYTVCARVINQNGAEQYILGGINEFPVEDLPYNSEIIVDCIDGCYTLIVSSDRNANNEETGEDIIWLNSSNNNAYYVRLSDVQIVSERSYYEWKLAIT